MKLYLIRHGIAEDRNNYHIDQDHNRPLSQKGRNKTNKVADRLVELGVRFDIILSSPFLRAKQTAEIFHQKGLSKNLEYFTPLRPDGNIQDFLNWFRESVYNEMDRSIALIGHQPDLSNWAEKLIWQTSNDKIILKKAGIIGLQLTLTSWENHNIPPKAELFLVTSPSWILNPS